MKKFFIKKVLIIGGTGFIGFHVAKYCKKILLCILFQEISQK